MLYFDSNNTNGVFHINTRANSGDVIDIQMIKEGETSSSYDVSLSLFGGGYFQSITFDTTELNSNLSNGNTYDMLAYSGGLLVYKDKMFFDTTRDVTAGESLHDFTENSTNNDYIII